SLSPLERKILPHLKSSIEEIKNLSGLDETSILRALRLLENKKAITISTSKKNLVVLGTNGIYYKKNHLPERQLITLLESNNHLPLQEAKKLSKLSDNEFKVSLGILKNKTLIELKNGKISLTASKDILTRKTPEEQLIEILPLEESSLTPEQLHTLGILKKRKNIVTIEEKSITSFKTTPLGEKLSKLKLSDDLLEEVTPDLIKNWKKNRKFRKYDVNAPVPNLYGGKKHFVSQAIENGKRIWLDLGFQEMQGSMVQTSFWNFDALFTAQDHPVREMQDTFFISDVEGKLPDKKLVDSVKKSHEQGVSGSKGWQYTWSEEESKSVVLRTHTTCLSAQTLANLDTTKLPAKFFSVAKCFRNETVDWSHGFEFNQTEGIVVDENANFRNLIAYLQEFAKKMGFDKVRIQPAYFPYTEPSVEGAVWNPEKKQWVEVLAAGIFRPEVTEPLLGKPIPVLAWGPGFDRMMMLASELSDLRQVYQNDIKLLREKKAVIK
ncbi:MAG: phenylalanine--tRNA ligase subunit alpha, partial [Nanoarchaeota archaeon]|nr:phenylalanine--tRNA ligase subunit alpha [Nanoarchaeota archaeon]